MEYVGFDSQTGTDKYKLFIGDVVSVDSTKQTMDVTVSGFGLFPNIPINNAISLSGSGIRIMPVPNSTKVLLYEQAGDFYHLGL